MRYFQTLISARDALKVMVVRKEKNERKYWKMYVFWLKIWLKNEKCEEKKEKERGEKEETIIVE